jgi:hypothetical protein
MKPVEGPGDLYVRLEGAVAFRLFADGEVPTPTVPEQIAARVGDRIIAKQNWKPRFVAQAEMIRYLESEEAAARVLPTDLGPIGKR